MYRAQQVGTPRQGNSQEGLIHRRIKAYDLLVKNAVLSYDFKLRTRSAAAK